MEAYLMLIRYLIFAYGFKAQWSPDVMENIAGAAGMLVTVLWAGYVRGDYHKLINWLEKFRKI